MGTQNDLDLENLKRTGDFEWIPTSHLNAAKGIIPIEPIIFCSQGSLDSLRVILKTLKEG